MPVSFATIVYCESWDKWLNGGESERMKKRRGMTVS